MGAKVELVTLFRGKDSATYLASEFEKYGDNATPIRVVQNPTSREPWVEMKLKDTDGVARYTEEPITKKDLSNSGKWDIKALKKLI